MAYINIYRLDCHYGGPEEGGWWWDSGEPVVSIPLHACFRDGEPINLDHDRVLDAVEALRVLFFDDDEYRRNVPRHDSHRVLVEDEPAVAWPAERPRYE